PSRGSRGFRPLSDWSRRTGFLILPDRPVSGARLLAQAPATKPRGPFTSKSSWLVLSTAGLLTAADVGLALFAPPALWHAPARARCPRPAVRRCRWRTSGRLLDDVVGPHRQPAGELRHCVPFPV